MTESSRSSLGAEADLWLAQYRDCDCEPVGLTPEKARFVRTVHAGHGPGCHQYLAATAFLGSAADAANDSVITPHLRGGSTMSSSTPSGTDTILDELRGSGSSLHIVMVAPPYFEVPPGGYGGVEAVVAQLADALVDCGHRVTLLGAGRTGTKADFVPVWDEILVDRLGETFPEVLNALKVRRIIAEIARHDRVDVVHDHTFAGPLSAPMYKLLGIPTVVTVHGPVDGDAGEYYRALDDTAHLVAISDRQRSLATDLNWLGRVYNSIRPYEFPYRTDKQDFALFLGRYASYKGPDLALKAAHEADLPLVLAAKMNEPPEKEYFERSVRPLLSERDFVFGEADSIAKKLLLSEAKCLLFPIQWEEPFGIVMIEAMACGTPVVALRGGAVEEVVEDGVTGIICADPAELPAAIAEIDRIDPAECRRRVIERFSHENLGAGYEAVYYAALESAELPRIPAAVTGRRQGRTLSVASNS